MALSTAEVVPIRVRVRHRIDRLAEDYAAIPAKAQVGLARIARDNVNQGRDLAKALAREGAGPHGQNYWKRISAEMTGAFEGEWGPTGTPKTEFVGVGFRSGINTDLPQSADKVAQSAAADVRKLVTRLYS